MDKLAKVLAEQFNCTVEYAKQHLPELMHDYCMYKGIFNLVMAVICLMIIVACVFTIVSLIKSNTKARNTKSDTFLCTYWSYHEKVELSGYGIMAVIVSVIGIFFGGIGLVAFPLDMIEAFWFPNVYILEKVLEVI